MNWQKCRRKQAVLRNCSKIYMKGLTKSVKTHSWDLNWVRPECKSISLLAYFVCVFGVDIIMVLCNE